MKKIQIDTTQNVLVQYQLATTGERFLAVVIDAVVIWFLLFIFGLMFSGVPVFSEVIAYLLVAVYSPVLETFNHGRTLGKMAVNTKVVKVNGEQAEAFDYITRWSTKGLEVYLTLGTLAGLTSFFSNKGQRVGDMLANTVVIKQENIGRLNLARITDLKKYEDYEPTYPQVIQLNEEDVILIHETYNRYKKHSNEGHKSALVQLVEALKVKLDISKVSNSELFIKQLIKDYVILTR